MPDKQPLVMLIEDEPFVALAVSELLSEMGLAAAGPFRTNAEAAKFLAQQRPTMAILDYTLGAATAASTATLLKASSVPFLVLSGNSRDVTDAPEFADVEWITKPFPEAQLVDAIGRCLDQAKNG